MVAIPLLILLSALANFKVVHTKFQQDRTIIAKTGFGKYSLKKIHFFKDGKMKEKIVPSKKNKNIYWQTVFPFHEDGNKFQHAT